MVWPCGEEGEQQDCKKSDIGECASSCSVGRPQKRRIDTVKDCLKKRGLDARQARRMVHDRGFVRGKAWCVAWGDEPLTLTRCHSLMKP